MEHYFERATRYQNRLLSQVITTGFFEIKKKAGCLK